jgi:RHS repeat-associated protein
MTDASGSSSYSYNANGQLTSETNGASQTLTYSYTDSGLLASIAYPGSRTVSYSYTTAGRLGSVTDWNSNTTSYTWSVDGQLATQTDPNGVAQAHTYDSAGQTTDLSTTDATSILAQYGYGYDDAGQLVSDSTTDPILSAVSHTYTYDALNQVLSGSDGTTTVGYDPTSAGQLAGIGDNTLTYNSAQRLTDLTPTSGPATSFSYDDNGSRTNATVAASSPDPAQSTGYGYDAALNLTTVTLPGDMSPTVSYTSNGDGLRQNRTHASTTTDFLWSTAGGLPLLLDDGTNSYVYGASSTPIAQIDGSNTTTYLFGDVLGSVRLITDDGGAVVGTTEYDTYGNRTDHAGTGDSPIGYTGNWTEPTTGLVYLRARDYDAVTGQFLTTDPLVDQTRQPYAYTGNNPLLATDPTGLYFNFGSGDWNALANAVNRLVGNIGGFLAGIGDGATFWGTESIRETIAPGSTCTISKNGFYYTGVGVGIGAITIASLGVGDVALGGARVAQNEQNAAAELQTASRTYQTYTKTNELTGQVYSGRTSGFGSPIENVAARDASHAYSSEGFGPAIIDRSSSIPGVIRGREQQLIDGYRGLGISANKINGVSPRNPNYEEYMGSARKAFGG